MLFVFLKKQMNTMFLFSSPNRMFPFFVGVMVQYRMGADQVLGNNCLFQGQKAT